MPLNGSDVASRVPGAAAVSGQTISSAKYNSEIADIYDILNTTRSIAKGYTGASTAQGALDNFFTGATFVEADKMLLADASDNTKLVDFDVSGVTTGTTRTVTWPDADITVVGTAATQTLTNKSLSDSTTSFVDNSDNTKALKFECSGITTATTRTATWPDSDLTVAGINVAQTWTAAQVFTDSGFLIQDNSDNTKRMGFQVSGVTTGQTRIMTVPDASGTLALLNLAQTWTASQAYTGQADWGTFSSTGASSGKRINSSGQIFLVSSVDAGSAQSHQQFFNPNGLVGSIITNGGSTGYITSSDERQKDFIGEFPPEKAVEIILADPVREWNWTANGDYDAGWGAQTSMRIASEFGVPNLASHEEDGDSWGVDKGARTPYLWAALSWAITEIKDLKTLVSELEEKVEQLS